LAIIAAECFRRRFRIDPPSPELVGFRHYLIVTGTIGATVSIVGAIAAYFWTCSERRKPPAERRGPAILRRVLEQIESGVADAERSHQAVGVLGWLVAVFTAATFVNFGVFAFATAYIGGAAQWGKVVDGRYFVGSHGHFTEVSEAVFRYSVWHFHSTWISFLVLLAVAAVLELRERRGKRQRDR